MNEAERRLADDRATRNAARAVFDSRLAQVKADLAARSVGGRIADKAKSDAKAVLAEAVDVANDSKGIIAGAGALLLLWFFRQPVMAWALAQFGKEAGADSGIAAEEDSDRD